VRLDHLLSKESLSVPFRDRALPVGHWLLAVTPILAVVESFPSSLGLESCRYRALGEMPDCSYSVARERRCRVWTSFENSIASTSI